MAVAPNPILPPFAFRLKTEPWPLSIDGPLFMCPYDHRCKCTAVAKGTAKSRQRKMP
jgi:hypothetical protein